MKDLKDLKDLKPPFVHAIRRLINLVLYLPRHAFLPIYIMKFTTAIFLTTYLVGASGKCGLYHDVIFLLSAGVACMGLDRILTLLLCLCQYFIFVCFTLLSLETPCNHS